MPDEEERPRHASPSPSPRKGREGGSEERGKRRASPPARAAASRSRSPAPPRDRRAVSKSRSRSPPRDKVKERRRSPSRSHSRSKSRDRSRRSRSPERSRRRSRSPPRRSSRSPQRRPSPARPGCQLFVAGFNFICNERDVIRKFSRYGRVKDVRLVRGPGGDSRGFGFIDMDHEDDAKAAIRGLDQTEWNGRRLLVEIAKRPRPAAY